MPGGLSVFADSPALLVSSTNGATGQTVYVSVSISENPGVAMFKLKVEYDKKRAKRFFTTSLSSY